MAVLNDEGAQAKPCADNEVLAAVRSKSRPKKVLLVDKHAMVRESLLLMLDQRLPGHLWREAATLATALRVLRNEPDTDLVLLGLDLADGQGLTTLRRVRESAPEVPLLVLSTHDELDGMRAVTEHGVAGFLSKTMAAAQLVLSVRRVLAGGVILPAAKGWAAPGSAGQPDLTERQRDVLRLLIQGQSNKHIARVLGLTEATVKTHLQLAYRKLEVESRTQAMQAAARWQLRL